MSNAKISIRFFDDREVRTIWDEENAKWWFSVSDIKVLAGRDDYSKSHNYWKYLKERKKRIGESFCPVEVSLLKRQLTFNSCAFA